MELLLYISSSVQTSVTIGGLDPFTYYTVVVRAVGEGDLEGLLTAASVFMDRTHADTDTPPTTDPTAETDTRENTFQLVLPDPKEIDTGPVMYVMQLPIWIVELTSNPLPPFSPLSADFMPLLSFASLTISTGKTLPIQAITRMPNHLIPP